MEWTDELVKEYARKYATIKYPNPKDLEESLEVFKKLKERPISVEVLLVNDNQIMAFTAQKFDNTRLNDIKQAIENCLNGKEEDKKYSLKDFSNAFSRILGELKQ